MLLGAVGTGSVLHAAHRVGHEGPAAGGRPDRARPAPSRSGRRPGAALLVRNLAWGPHRDEIATVPADDPEGPRTASGVKCLRFHAAAGTGICLQAVHGALEDTYRAVVLDAHLRERHRFPAAGIPTRARVSPCGHMVAWTVFVSGDSYAGTNFSTRTAIVDTRTWAIDDNLETFRIVKDGRTYHAADTNVWGVTFADDNHFYATLATGGRTYLVRGRRHRAHSHHPAPQRRMPLPLPRRHPHRVQEARQGSLARRPLAAVRPGPAHHEGDRDRRARNIDDQALWADDDTLVYALPGDYGSDLWTVPADGTGTARRLMTSAVAPAYLG